MIHQLSIIEITRKNYKKKARERYQSLSKEEKAKKEQYGRERYKNLSEDEKQKLVEYGTKYYDILIHKVYFVIPQSKPKIIKVFSIPKVCLFVLY